MFIKWGTKQYDFLFFYIHLNAKVRRTREHFLEGKLNQVEYYTTFCYIFKYLSTADLEIAAFQTGRGTGFRAFFAWASVPPPKENKHFAMASPNINAQSVKVYWTQNKAKHVSKQQTQGKGRRTHLQLRHNRLRLVWTLHVSKVHCPRKPRKGLAN